MIIIGHLEHVCCRSRLGQVEVETAAFSSKDNLDDNINSKLNLTININKNVNKVAYFTLGKRIRPSKPSIMFCMFLSLRLFVSSTMSSASSVKRGSNVDDGLVSNSSDKSFA